MQIGEELKKSVEICKACAVELLRDRNHKFMRKLVVF